MFMMEYEDTTQSSAGPIVVPNATMERALDVFAKLNGSSRIFLTLFTHDNTIRRLLAAGVWNGKYLANYTPDGHNFFSAWNGDISKTKVIVFAGQQDSEIDSNLLIPAQTLQNIIVDFFATTRMSTTVTWIDDYA